MHSVTILVGSFWYASRFYTLVILLAVSDKKTECCRKHVPDINRLKPSNSIRTTSFNTLKLLSTLRVSLCRSFSSRNKLRLFPQIASLLYICPENELNFYILFKMNSVLKGLKVKLYT